MDAGGVAEEVEEDNVEPDPPMRDGRNSGFDDEPLHSDASKETKNEFDSRFDSITMKEQMNTLRLFDGMTAATVVG